MGTPFAKIYNRFLGKITDDMYMELTPEDTLRDLSSILIEAIPAFEFPRFNTYDYTISSATIPKEDYVDGQYIISETEDTYQIDTSSYNVELTEEEINILAIVMMNSWLQRQIVSIENIRMKYSGPDFKLTSQANHLGKLITLATECRRDSTHMQRLYKRRRIRDDGRYEPNWDVLREYKALDYQV